MPVFVNRFTLDTRLGSRSLLAIIAPVIVLIAVACGGGMTDEELTLAIAEAQQAAAQLEQLQAGVDTASTVANIPGLKDALEGAAAA